MARSMTHMDVAEHADTAITALARAGYASRGVVYLIVGALAFLAAVGEGGKTADSRGALLTLLEHPFGKVLLVIIGVGLLGYSLWRSIQAVKDPDHHGTDAKGIAVRTALAVSAVLHVGLAVYAFSLVFMLGGSSGGGGNGSQEFAGWLMQQPYGRWLVGIAGIAVIGAGIAHGIKGWHAKFTKRMRIPPDKQGWAYPLCRFGLVIRGVVLVIIGGMFLVAAYQVDPSQAGGLQEALNAVRSQVFGQVLLGIVGVGLAAFGLYSFLQALYRKVEPTA